MKILQKLDRVEIRSAFLFLVLGTTWVLISHLIFRPDLTVALIFVGTATVPVFFGMKYWRKYITRMSEEYKTLFETHPSPMWIFDLDTLRFIAVNEAATRHYGYTRKEFLSMTILDIQPEEDIPAIRKILDDRTPRKGRETVWKHIHKNGTESMVKLVSNDVTFRKKKARLISAHDITALLAQQQEIREMSLVAENTTNGVILSDGQGKIKWVNRAFEVTTGYTLEEVKGKHPRSFLHGEGTDKRVEAEIIELAKNKKGFVGDIVNYKKDGSTYWVHLNLSPIIKEGKVENVVVIQTDITELKQQSEQINDQYRRLREVAFMTSHNARSQLTNILSLCDIINDECMDPGQRQLASYLKESATKLDEVIHNIIKQTSAMEEGQSS